MIEYIEVRGNDTNVIGIVDVANSIIWHSVYFGVGDFEIHAHATPAVVSLLIAGRYIPSLYREFAKSAFTSFTNHTTL